MWNAIRFKFKKVLQKHKLLRQFGRSNPPSTTNTSKLLKKVEETGTVQDATQRVCHRGDRSPENIAAVVVWRKIRKHQFLIKYIKKTTLHNILIKDARLKTN